MSITTSLDAKMVLRQSGDVAKRQRAQRRQPHDGQPDTQVGARQPGLVGEGCALVHLAEPPGHVAQGGYDAELPEPRSEDGDSHPGYGPVVPAAQPQPARPGPGTLPGSALNAACLFHDMFHVSSHGDGEGREARQDHADVRLGTFLPQILQGTSPPRNGPPTLC